MNFLFGWNLDGEDGEDNPQIKQIYCGKSEEQKYSENQKPTPPKWRSSLFNHKTEMGENFRVIQLFILLFSALAEKFDFPIFFLSAILTLNC